MGQREVLLTHNEQSLLPLVGKSDLLQVRGGQVYSEDRLPVPLNEYGVPQPKELVRDVLGTLATRHFWTGYYDLHHVAWPGSDYRRIRTEPEPMLGGLYRGTGALKIRMPRQLHNYIHAVTEPPPLPSREVMEQWVMEATQIDRLYNTIRLQNFSNFNIPEEQKEKYRFSNYLQKLEVMEDGQLGIMPDRDYLAQLEIDSARRTLRALARARGFSNARKQQKQFFEGSILAA